MDDNNIPTPPQNLPTGEDVQGAEKIFDISPDLNISPVEDGTVVPFENPVSQIPPKPVAPSLSPTVPKPKEPLFSFKGYDIRSGQKEQILAKPVPKSSLQDVAGIQAPQPKPPVQPSSSPISSPIPTPVPQPPTKPAPIIPVTPAKVAPTIRTISTATAPIMPNRAGSEASKALRTYEGDVAEVLAHKGTSAASIAIAENKRDSGQDQIGGPVENSHAKKKIAITILSLILICAGVIGAYYLYSISPLAPIQRTVPQPETAPSLVTSDSKIVISIDGMDTTKIINAVRTEMAKSQASNSIKEIVLAQTKNGQRFRIAGSDMVNIMGIDAPDNLQRALNTDWMLGIYSDMTGAKTVFIIATVDYFQNAFAGMLQWESNMADDMKQYLYQNTPSDITTASTSTTMASTTSATSTAQVPAPYVILRGSFIDRIIKNKDVREFVTGNGNALFLYSFIDNTKLVITGSESALSAILDRLEQQTFVR